MSGFVIVAAAWVRHAVWTYEPYLEFKDVTRRRLLSFLVLGVRDTLPPAYYWPDPLYLPGGSGYPFRTV